MRQRGWDTKKREGPPYGKPSLYMIYVDSL